MDKTVNAIGKLKELGDRCQATISYNPKPSFKENGNNFIPWFTDTCVFAIDQKTIAGCGEGFTKKEAKQEAARKCLGQLVNCPNISFDSKKSKTKVGQQNSMTGLQSKLSVPSMSKVPRLVPPVLAHCVEASRLPRREEVPKMFDLSNFSLNSDAGDYNSWQDLKTIASEKGLEVNVLPVEMKGKFGCLINLQKIGELKYSKKFTSWGSSQMSRDAAKNSASALALTMIKLVT